MVSSATVIQSTFFDSGRNTTPRSFVAFERLSGADSRSTRNISELFGADPNMNGRTAEGTSDIEELEGMRTRHYQPCYPPKIFHAIPDERELSEVKTIWQV